MARQTLEQPVPLLGDLADHRLPVIDERDDEVGRAVAVALTHPQVEAFGIGADAIDDPRGIIALQPEHARAQPVAEQRQGVVTDVARRSYCAGLAGDFALRRKLAGDDDVATIRAARMGILRK